MTASSRTTQTCRSSIISVLSPCRSEAIPQRCSKSCLRVTGGAISWRNGIYDYVHYHSGTHEVLGIARGHARVRFGGNSGKVVELQAGDVAILPAGTGHQSLNASKDLLVVGAYPRGGKYDECRGSRQEHERALKSIPKVPLPAEDPVYGADGPLMKAWSD